MDIIKSSIINYFTKRRELQDEEIKFLAKVFEVKEYRKKDFIIQKGEVCDYIYFIEKGIIKTFFIDDHNKEAINGIAIENNFCTSVASFISQFPSSENLQALEETKLLAISYHNFKKLVETYPVYKDIYIKILEDYLKFMTWRMESVMLMDSKSRYNTLMNFYPKLFLRVSNYDMAMYLGMSPET